MVRNAGTIGGTTVSGRGLNIGAGSTIATLTNTGTIEVGSGTGINDAGTITSLNNTGGTISATTGQALVRGSRIGTLTNAGTITSTNVTSGQGTIDITADLGVSGQTFGVGTIRNTGGGTALEIGAVQTGVITNAGMITSAGGTARGLRLCARQYNRHGGVGQYGHN